MKAKNLIKKVELASKLKNKLIPILDNILFEENTMTVSNLDITIQFDIDKLCNEPVLIPIREFKKIIKGIDKEKDVSFTKHEGHVSVLIDGKERFQLPLHHVDDFPEHPETKGKKIKLHKESYTSLLTAFSHTSNDELRPVMNFVEISDHIAASDAHTLYCDKQNISKTPVYVNRNIENLMDKSDCGCSIEYNYKWVTIHYEDYRITHRAMDGNYPDWRAVLPKNNPISLRVDKKELLNNIKLAMITANPASELVKLSISDKIKLESSDEDFNVSFSSEIQADHKGDDILIGFKGSLLTKCLNSIDEDEIFMTMSEPGNAVLINYKVLIMPMMIQYAE